MTRDTSPKHELHLWIHVSFLLPKVSLFVITSILRIVLHLLACTKFLAVHSKHGLPPDTNRERERLSNLMTAQPLVTLDIVDHADFN